MAKSKKAFVAYNDWNEVFKDLDNEEAGLLAKRMFAYVNDCNEVSDNRLVEVLFKQLKLQIDRDAEKYESVKERRAEAGRKGGLKSGEMRSKSEANEASASIAKKNEANEADTDTGTGTVTKTGTVKKTKKELMEERKLKFASTLTPYNTTYPRDMLKDFYKYWTEPNKSQTKFKQELEPTWDLERRLNTWADRDKNFKNGQSVNNTGANSSNGYQAATVNPEKLIRELTEDIENGNIPGQY